MKWISLFLILLLLSCSGKKAGGSFSGNPILDGWYADPEVVIFGDEYWIFPTYSAAFEEQVFLDAFSSKDLVHWEKHPRIIDTSIVKWAEKAIWAPSAIKKNEKYYLFFAANDIQSPVSPWWNPEIHREGEVGGIGIAVADRPEGLYKDYLGKPLINEFHHDSQPIDQYVFKDIDGQYNIVYGGWGHCVIARLNDDFTGFIPFDDGAMTREITPEGYVEGPVLFYRNNKYYFMWSEGNWGDDSYKVAYAISDSLSGPYQRIATILESDTDIATGAGHHSVLNIPATDDWYIVYHRRPIPNEGRDHRVTCIDSLKFNADGTIQQVKMTLSGVLERKLN